MTSATKSTPKPLLRSLDSYIAAVSTGHFLSGKQKILVVGDAGGRERAYLSSLGKEVDVLDLCAQEEVPNLVIQSIETRTPFPDQLFDGVVLNEVLEHLFLDVAALEEVRRILKDNGVLVITLPYFSNRQDLPEFHVRVHSPRTIRRLLENCGFQLEDHFCRGFSSSLPPLSKLTAALIRVLQKGAEKFAPMDPDRAVDFVNRNFLSLEKWLGSSPYLTWFQRLFSTYGGIMSARKSSKKDFHQIQKSYFSSQPT